MPMDIDIFDDEEINDDIPATKKSDPVIRKNSFLKGNCSEHIVFALDVCKEKDKSFCFSDGSDDELFDILKKTLNIFMQNKSRMNARHKYALILLQDVPHWKTGFTSNFQEILDELIDIDEIESPNKCDLAQLFKVIDENSALPSISDGNSMPPYIVRTVLIYGRSQCLPQFLEGRETFLKLYSHPCFFLDCIYVHEEASDDNRCEGIYELLLKLDEERVGYIFDAKNNARSLFNYFGNLLAHPLQRPQRDSIHTTLTAD